MKLYNRNFPCTERIEYMGWVNEAITDGSLTRQTYKPKFLTLKGMDILIFESPPVSSVLPFFFSPSCCITQVNFYKKTDTTALNT